MCLEGKEWEAKDLRGASLDARARGASILAAAALQSRHEHHVASNMFQALASGRRAYTPAALALAHHTSHPLTAVTRVVERRLALLVRVVAPACHDRSLGAQGTREVLAGGYGGECARWRRGLPL